MKKKSSLSSAWIYVVAKISKNYKWVLDQTNPTENDTKHSDPETKISSTCWGIATEQRHLNSNTDKYFDDIKEQTQNTSSKSWSK